MIDFCSFNVRGLNNNYSYIRDFNSSKNISLIGLLDTRVNKDLASIISSKLSRNFQWRMNFILMVVFGLVMTLIFGISLLFLLQHKLSTVLFLEWIIRLIVLWCRLFMPLIPVKNA